MIKEGSTVVLRTKYAVYCTCKILNMSKSSLTITYCAGTKRDNETGEILEKHITETISLKEVVKMSERN